MTEAELQRGVIETAHALGYLVAHFRPAQTAQGWRTPVEGDGKGFPDLVVAGRGRLIFAELKGERGRLSPEQSIWLAELGRAGAETGIWTPREWSSGEVEAALRWTPNGARGE